MPSKKKKYNARFPPARIKKIMQTDEEVGKVAAAVPVIISRALELFVESLVKKASDITKARNAKTLTTSHLKACILADSNFHFLKDLVATIPDVQGEDESSTPGVFEGQMVPAFSYHSKIKRSRERGAGDESAGPSQSTADESETWSAEEDGEEDSDDSSSETTSDHQVVSSLQPSVISPSSCSLTFTASVPHHYLPHQVPYLQNCSTTSSAEDEDYDS